MKCIAPSFGKNSHPDFEHCSPPGHENYAPTDFDQPFPPLLACAPAEFDDCTSPGSDSKHKDYTAIHTAQILCVRDAKTPGNAVKKTSPFSVLQSKKAEQDSWRTSLDIQTAALTIRFARKHVDSNGLRSGFFPSPSAGFKPTL